MDAASWLGLQPTHNPHRWWLPVVPGVASGGHFLFGGCGLGAAVAAMEATTGRPAIWATAQYLSFAQVDSTVDIDVTLAVEGRKTTQARAVGLVGGTEILTVNAALGRRDLPVAGRFTAAPVVPPPLECRVREHTYDHESIGTRLEQRIALVEHPGRVVLWTRMHDLLEPSAATLAVLGDWVPLGIGMSVDDPVHSNSLDNTIRVLGSAPTEWYLLDIRIDGIADGYGHGSVHIYAEDGTLLATASQSAMLRRRR